MYWIRVGTMYSAKCSFAKSFNSSSVTCSVLDCTVKHASTCSIPSISTAPWRCYLDRGRDCGSPLSFLAVLRDFGRSRSRTFLSLTKTPNLITRSAFRLHFRAEKLTRIPLFPLVVSSRLTTLCHRFPGISFYLPPTRRGRPMQSFAKNFPSSL